MQAMITWPWLIFWLLAFAALGAVIGWSFKSLMVERRECAWCADPVENSGTEYCRRHGDYLRERRLAGRD